MERHREQIRTTTDGDDTLNSNNTRYLQDEINCNHLGGAGAGTEKNPSPTMSAQTKTVRELNILAASNSNTNSNCNSFDSSSTNNSDDINTGSDYESCNGLDDDRQIDGEYFCL